MHVDFKQKIYQQPCIDFGRDLMSVMSKGICTTWWHVHCQNLQVDHFQGESQYTLILQIHTHTLINYFFDTRICTILTLRRFPPSPSQSLFLASTVSTMHTNSHIWNASHPLVVTYYCWVAVYSPIMKAKKKVMCQPLGVELPMSVMGLILPTTVNSTFESRRNFFISCQTQTF